LCNQCNQCKQFNNNNLESSKQRNLAAGLSENNILYADINGNISRNQNQLQADKPVKATLSGKLISYTESGMVAYFAMQTPPSGWLVCDGAVYSSDIYPDLFAAIGTTYGGVFSSKTFKVPNLQGYFIRGYDPTGSVDIDRNKAGFGVVQSDRFKQHTHQTGAGRGNGGEQGFRTESVDSSIKTQNSDDGGSETRPKNIAMLACIKI
jgi:microcystin-dependent protein